MFSSSPSTSERFLKDEDRQKAGARFRWGFRATLTMLFSSRVILIRTSAPHGTAAQLRSALLRLSLWET